MTIDIVTADGVALDIKDTFSHLALNSGPELLGRLVEALVTNGTLTGRDLLHLLPFGYEVRIDD